MPQYAIVFIINIRIIFQSIFSIFYKQITQSEIKKQRKMLISPQQYLSLTDQISLLSLKCKTYETEQAKQHETIIRQAETIKNLNARIQQEMQKTKNTELQLIKCIDLNAEQVNKKVQDITKQLRQYFCQELNKIKNDANILKIKQMEKKMAQNRFINHQMVDFYQKIQNLYMILNNTRTTPSMPELYKWASMRKAEQTNLNNTFLNAMVSLGATQKSMNNSKINISRINNQKTNGIPSTVSISKINKSKLKTSSRPPTGKQNQNNMKSSSNQKKSQIANKQKIGKNNLTNKKNLQLESQTQVINIGNFSQLLPSNKIVSQINDNSSIVQPIQGIL